MHRSYFLFRYHHLHFPVCISFHADIIGNHSMCLIIQSFSMRSVKLTSWMLADSFQAGLDFFHSIILQHYFSVLSDVHRNSQLKESFRTNQQAVFCVFFQTINGNVEGRLGIFHFSIKKNEACLCKCILNILVHLPVHSSHLHSYSNDQTCSITEK